LLGVGLRAELRGLDEVVVLLALVVDEKAVAVCGALLLGSVVEARVLALAVEGRAGRVRLKAADGLVVVVDRELVAGHGLGKQSSAAGSDDEESSESELHCFFRELLLLRQIQRAKDHPTGKISSYVKVFYFSMLCRTQPQQLPPSQHDPPASPPLLFAATAAAEETGAAAGAPQLKAPKCSTRGVTLKNGARCVFSSMSAVLPHTRTGRPRSRL
jgi:hypothetical protein